MKWLLALMLALMSAPTGALAQQSLLQGGAWNSGHAPMYTGPGGSQPVVQDSGPASGGATAGVGFSEMGLTVRGTGTAPYANAGTGPFGTNWCDYDAPIGNPTGYHFLCLGPNSTSGGLTGGLIAYGAGGTASQLPLNMNINGTNYQFPFSLSGIVGPATSISGDVACWNNTQGSLLKDCGAFPVTAGLINQVAWFAASGSVVSGLATANSGILVTSVAGVPSISTSTPSGLTIVSPTMSGTVTGGTYASATLASPTLSGTVAGANTIPYSILQQGGANTQLCNTTGSTANITASGACNNQAGSGTGTFLPSGRVYSAFIPVGNGADTTEDVLQSFSLPANTLAVNGQAVRVRAWGSLANNGDTKVVKVYFGGSSTASISTATPNVGWSIDAMVIRSSGTVQYMSILAGVGSAVSTTQIGPTETLSGAVTIKVTGQDSSTSTANTIVCNAMIIEVLN